VFNFFFFGAWRISELQRAASETKYDEQGFVVMHAAMAKEDGSVFFPRGAQAGVENKGISNAGCSEGMASDCINVTMYSLDTYTEKFIPKGVQINYLSVDVEGWDFEVLLGGKRALLQVHYLEFEYNWVSALRMIEGYAICIFSYMLDAQLIFLYSHFPLPVISYLSATLQVGPWKRQPLSEVIEYLDGQYGFSCYWAGFNNTLWRITNCWLDHYEAHFWSNIACVNRNIDDVRDLADNMEHLFIETLAKGGDAVRDFNHRFQRSDG
jgi:FkbM family methyltransferase